MGDVNLGVLAATVGSGDRIHLRLSMERRGNVELFVERLNP